MKKWFFIILIIGINAANSALAQGKNTGNIFKNEDKKFFGSINVGGVASQVDGDDFGGYNKLGLTAGPSVLVQLNNNWVMQVGLFYTQKGSRNGKANDSDLGLSIDRYKLNLHFFDVPVMFNYVVKQTYLFGVGATYNAYISSKESMETFAFVREYDPQEFKFRRHSAELVFNAAAMANKNLMLYMRYHYGVLPIRLHVDAATGRSNQINNYFTFGVAYLF